MLLFLATDTAVPFQGSVNVCETFSFSNIDRSNDATYHYCMYRFAVESDAGFSPRQQKLSDAVCDFVHLEVAIRIGQPFRGARHMKEVIP